jgi:hypothetical protein
LLDRSAPRLGLHALTQKPVKSATLEKVWTPVSTDRDDRPFARGNGPDCRLSATTRRHRMRQSRGNPRHPKTRNPLM